MGPYIQLIWQPCLKWSRCCFVNLLENASSWLKSDSISYRSEHRGAHRTADTAVRCVTHEGLSANSCSYEATCFPLLFYVAVISHTWLIVPHRPLWAAQCHPCSFPSPHPQAPECVSVWASPTLPHSQTAGAAARRSPWRLDPDTQHILQVWVRRPYNLETFSHSLILFTL